MKTILFVFNVLIYIFVITLSSYELSAQNDSISRKQKVDGLISKYNKAASPGASVVIVRDGVSFPYFRSNQN